VTPARDPTKVVTRRCVAFLLDALILVLLIAFAAWVTPGALDVSEDCPDPVPDGDACFQWEQDAYLIDGRAFVLFLLVLAALLTVVLIGTRRMTGASPGKTLFGIRVVDAAGDDAAFWREGLRTLALGIDGLVLLLPIGLWLVWFTPGHRRLGDFLAGTWVVRSDAVGRPPPRRGRRRSSEPAVSALATHRSRGSGA
jgi:uncharacterized RDD family membrane protein YckC